MKNNDSIKTIDTIEELNDTELETVRGGIGPIAAWWLVTIPSAALIAGNSQNTNAGCPPDGSCPKY